MQALRHIGARSVVVLRQPPSRNLIACCALCSHEKMEHLENNQYFDKYKAKLAKLQESSPDDFHSKVEAMLEAKKPKKPQPQPRSEPAASTSQSNAQKSLLSSSKDGGQKGKDLNSVMKVELIQDKTAEEISQIWKEYHGKKDGIFAVIDSKEYDEINSKAKQFPLFLFPVPRSQGYEFLLAQFSGHQCYFTPLIAYQNYQENAPPCLTINHYPELSEEKGIVLMNGEYDEKVINAEIATILAHQLQMYYGHQGPSRFHLVEKFNKEPNSFKHGDLISEFENITAGQFVKKT